MEATRRAEINKTRNEISILEKSISRQKEILNGLNRIKISKEILEAKTSEITDDIFLKENQVQDLTKKIEEIEVGLHDQKFASETKKNTAEAVKRTPIPEKPKADPELKKPPWKRAGYEKSDKQREKEYGKMYERFCSIGDSLPPYIRSNLAKMGNNKGYIFRGCWFFGSLPEERGQPMLLFEKNYDVMKIHEIFPHEHLVYEKRGKEQKRLVSRKLRKKVGERGRGRA